METTASFPPVFDAEVIAHVFIIHDEASADASGLIEPIWSRCREYLGATQETPAADRPAGVAAMAHSPDREFQSIVRREHDVVILSLLLGLTEAAQAERSQPRLAWQRLDALLDRVLGTPAETFLGVARLYVASTVAPSPPDVGTAIAGLLPGRPQQPGWWRRSPVTASGLTAWEISPGRQAGAERRIVVLAPPGGERDLGAWTWTDGALLPPFARYLKHVAKIRYEARVLAAAEPVAQLCRHLDTGLDELQILLQEESIARGTATAGRYRAAADQRAAVWADQARIATRVLRLKAMRNTVQIARDNAAAALPGLSPGEAGLLADDLELTSWLEGQLTSDLSYLESSYEGGVRLTGLADQMIRPPAEAAAAQPAEGTAAARGPASAAVAPGPVAPAPVAAVPARPAPAFGIVTALPEEFAAMKTLIDDGRRYPVADDRANYVVGTMPSLDPLEPHVVVLTQTGGTGNDAAAEAVAHLTRSFASVAVVLMVGIAAGVPDAERPEAHVRLGDIVVSTWGIIDYDHVTDSIAGRVLRQPFPRPSPLLCRQVNWLAGEELLGSRPWETWLDKAAEPELAGFARPPASTDEFFPAGPGEQLVAHPDPASSGHRPGRPKVHYGWIGSADRSLRNARVRDELAAEHKLRAIEMEGKGIGSAGFASGVEWLVIRGISDYGDSRADGRWRRHACLAAAAYARALLAQCPPVAPRGARTSALTQI